MNDDQEVKLNVERIR